MAYFGLTIDLVQGGTALLGGQQWREKGEDGGERARKSRRTATGSDTADGGKQMKRWLRVKETAAREVNGGCASRLPR